MVNIVTGYVGKPHLQAAEQGLFNGGVCGDKIVLPTNEQFKYVLNSNNSISICSGDLVNQGRHITIPFNSSEELVIENGRADYSRIDTVVMRYEKNLETSVESAKLLIIKGTAVNDNAVPPDVMSGNIYGGAVVDDMPLYNIHITDLAVTNVEQLYTVTSPLSDLTAAKKKVDITSNIISSKITANYTVIKDETIENLNLENNISAGETFDIKNGKLTIGADVSKVLVSAIVRMSPAKAGGKSLRIYKNDTNILFAYTKSDTSSFSICIPPRLIDVKQGDELALKIVGAKGDIVNSRSGETYLTVQAVS